MNDLSLTRDEQEIEFLRLQVLEQQHVIDDLSLVRLRSVTGPGVTASDGVSSTASDFRAMPSLILVTGTFLLSSAGEQPLLGLNSIAVPGSGFHGDSCLTSTSWFAVISGSIRLKRVLAGVERAPSALSSLSLEDHELETLRL